MDRTFEAMAPRTATLEEARQLGEALGALGFPASGIGRALLGAEATDQDAWRTGSRLLKGEHEVKLGRLAELARVLNVRITISPGGIAVQKV